MVIKHVRQSFKAEIKKHPTFISQAWLSFTSEHLLLATQVFVLLIEEVMMDKILKQLPHPLCFYDVHNLGKNIKYPQVLLYLN